MTNNLFDISGRVAVVTGGRRGLGLAMSEGLASAGAKLACIDIADECNQLRKMAEMRGVELTYFQADLADRSQRNGWSIGSSNASAGSTSWSTAPASSIGSQRWSSTWGVGTRSSA